MDEQRGIVRAGITATGTFRLVCGEPGSSKIMDREVSWAGKNPEGEAVPGGVYFLKVKTAGSRATRKMTPVR